MPDQWKVRVKISGVRRMGTYWLEQDVYAKDAYQAVALMIMRTDIPWAGTIDDVTVVKL